MGTNFTVVPRDGDQVLGNTVGVGRFVAAVPRSWSSNFQRIQHHTVNCELTEFDVQQMCQVKLVNIILLLENTSG